MYAIKKYYYYYDGTFGAPADDYLRGSDGRILAVRTKEEADKLVEGLDGQYNGPYCCNHGEYARPDHDVIKVVPDQRRVAVITESDFCCLFDLDYDLEIA